MVREVIGNLLEAQVEALVNTVNTVGVMGKGIALQFKHAYPDNYRAYAKACRENKVRLGSMFTHNLGGLRDPHYIINFPTKRHWRGKSRIEDIKIGLAALVEDVKRLGVRSIALPPLGCGNGGLTWQQVYPLIVEAFAVVPGVQVFVFAPAGSPPAEQMPNRTQRPAMTLGRAAMLALMNRYRAPGFEYRLSLLEVQKLVYFLTRAGELLKQVEFVKGTYGPYTHTLGHVLERLDGHFISGYGDGGNKPTTPITLKPEAAQEAEAFLQQYPATRQRFDRVVRLIEGFETPRGMELLASVDWVATREASAAGSDAEAVIQAVHAWSQRKRGLLSGYQIRTAWNRLREQKWI
jgi:O-acetyl-ADP-ribose deacetylase (regulator of RNase III)